ncbi:DNA-processing protein DprA [Nocardia panacis]|uniref:DNA-processing protein DprA n=1 Tax=Nocardia panacis TaxID=2340916 RepID=A0A3A4K1X1_9NOCA|nr:DNA-processing protein DprA [Nocardia panacis]
MLPWDDEERAALVALMRLHPKNAEWSALTERVTDRGSARRLWEDEHPTDLLGEGSEVEILRTAARDIESWKRARFVFHAFMDDSYPEQLRSVRRIPPVVFTSGELRQDDFGICVVGSRQVSDQGLKFAYSVARGLVENGVTVISGLARGVDTTAHRAALDASGRTVAVLGNGLDRVYPRENRGLQEEIAERGMLLTHYLPEYAPTRWSFPARNVTMSAYGMATVIVEAGETSGTRIQAREAVAHGRPVILNSSVVMSTTWARELRHQPGVYVARSPEHATEIVSTIRENRNQVSRWLSKLS